ncbi:mRNA-decapping enzyme 2 [Trichinella spiralis]|uniref:mRNA-decapping enzyme 2 n=1 Tax=Trichinella spiralis TaxID=6334 RepID=UPI0001EFCEEB|nr:mRNA-decapping enzyme 2 [Trichinella spiralis]
MPEEERTDPVRACFHIELAHWFYCDHFTARNGYPTCSLKEFIRAVFSNSADLQQYTSNLDDVLAQWRQYKSGVPVYGAILVNAQLDSVLLVQGFFARRSWGFPKGKINEGETVQQCAVREVLEETGYDIGKLMTDSPYLERKFGGYTCGLFLVTGVEHDFPFQPQTKNEIGRLQWFLIDALPKHSKDYRSCYQPKHFFTVTPFLHFIKMHIRNERSRLEALRTYSLVVMQGSYTTASDEEQISSKGIESFLFGNEDDPIISSSFRQVEEEVTNYERIRRGMKKDQPREVQIGSTRDLFGPLIGTPPTESEILQDIRMTTGLTPMATSSPIRTTCQIPTEVYTSKARVVDRWMRHRQPVGMPSDADDGSSAESLHSEMQSTSLLERAVEISTDQLGVIGVQSSTAEHVPVKSTARKRLQFDSFPTNESTSSMGSCEIDKEPCTSKQMMERDRMRRGNVTQESDEYLLDLNVIIVPETSADERAILQAEVDMLDPSYFVVTSVQAIPTNVTTTTITTTAASVPDIERMSGTSSAPFQHQYPVQTDSDSDGKFDDSTFSSRNQCSAGEITSRANVVYPSASACTNPECRHATLASMQQRVSERLGVDKSNANVPRLVPSTVPRSFDRRNRKYDNGSVSSIIGVSVRKAASIEREVATKYNYGTPTGHVQCPVGRLLQRLSCRWSLSSQSVTCIAGTVTYTGLVHTSVSISICAATKFPNISTCTTAECKIISIDTAAKSGVAISTLILPITDNAISTGSSSAAKFPLIFNVLSIPTIIGTDTLSSSLPFAFISAI